MYDIAPSWSDKEGTLKKLALFLLCFGLASTNFAQTKHVPTIDEQLSLKGINGHQISPDGRYIAYAVRETDWEDNLYVRQLWIVNVSTGVTFQLTRGKKSIEGFRWSPDGKWIAFTTEREQSAIVPPDKEKKDDASPDKKDDKKDEKRTATSPTKIRTRRTQNPATRAVNPPLTRFG